MDPLLPAGAAVLDRGGGNSDLDRGGCHGVLAGAGGHDVLAGSDGHGVHGGAGGLVVPGTVVNLHIVELEELAVGGSEARVHHLAASRVLALAGSDGRGVHGGAGGLVVPGTVVDLHIVELKELAVGGSRARVHRLVAGPLLGT